MKSIEEIWKDIPGYEGLYQVSNLGRIKSLNYARSGKSKICKQSYSARGYKQLSLSNNGSKKTILVHKLVAITFLGHKPDGYKKVIDHIDNDKTNNHLSNLQIITQRENSSKNHEGALSKYTGVSYVRLYKKWRSRIYINGKNKTLGDFDTEYEAHLAYQKELDSLKE